MTKSTVLGASAVGSLGSALGGPAGDAGASALANRSWASRIVRR